MDRVSTLKLATDAVTERHTHYGTPKKNFDAIAARWNAHLVNVGEEGNLTAEDVAVMLADVKLARLENDPAHLDSWADLAGYAACGAEVSGAGDSAPTTFNVVSINGAINPWWTRDLTDHVNNMLQEGQRVVMTREHAEAFKADKAKYTEAARAANVAIDARFFTPPVQAAPVWSRVHVGDKIRIRKGALSFYEKALPEVGIVSSNCMTLGPDYQVAVAGRAIRNEDILEILPSDAA